LYPVARTLSSLLEEPFLATTLQGVCFYLFRRYMFRPSLAIFIRNTQLFWGSFSESLMKHFKDFGSGFTERRAKLDARFCRPS
jgi:hypothetical protein